MARARWLYAALVVASGWAVFLGPAPTWASAWPQGVGGLLAWLLGGVLLALAWGRMRRDPASSGAAVASAPRLPAPRAGTAVQARGLRDEAEDGDPAAQRRGLAWQRFGAGMLAVDAFDPADAQRTPWTALDAQACIDRLAVLRPGWQTAAGQRARQQERRYWLDGVLALVDHGVLRPLHDGSLPDTAALRTERLLLGADPGPTILAEVPALFARRLALAIERLPDEARDAASVQWHLLRSLQPLAAEARALDERAQAAQLLAWNPDADLDQVAVAYALAADYRLRMQAWLRQAAAILLPETGEQLDQYLLAACPLLAVQGEDDLGYSEALRPLHVGFVRLLGARLGQLVTTAEQAEAEAGLRPLCTPSPAMPHASGA